MRRVDLRSFFENNELRTTAALLAIKNMTAKNARGAASNVLSRTLCDAFQVRGPAGSYQAMQYAYKTFAQRGYLTIEKFGRTNYLRLTAEGMSLLKKNEGLVPAVIEEKLARKT